MLKHKKVLMLFTTILFINVLLHPFEITDVASDEHLKAYSLKLDFPEEFSYKGKDSIFVKNGTTIEIYYKSATYNYIYNPTGGPSSGSGGGISYATSLYINNKLSTKSINSLIVTEDSEIMVKKTGGSSSGGQIDELLFSQEIKIQATPLLM